MWIERHLAHVWKYWVKQSTEFTNGTHFNNTLAQVVAKLITGNFWEDVQHALNQCTAKSALTRCNVLQPLLDHSAPTLVKAEGVDLLNKIFLLFGHFLLLLEILETSTIRWFEITVCKRWTEAGVESRLNPKIYRKRHVVGGWGGGHEYWWIL